MSLLGGLEDLTVVDVLRFADEPEQRAPERDGRGGTDDPAAEGRGRSREVARMILAALLVAAALQAPQAHAEGELRGLWVVRTALVSPEAVDRVVADASAAGLNALFVQVRGRGDAFYESDAVARSPLLYGQPQDFDPLARLLSQARARGLEVHAWVNVLLTSH